MTVRVMCVVVVVSSAVVLGATNYVSIGGNHVAPFTNWVDAARDIQSAINAAETGNVVLVQSGAYHGYGGYAGNASNMLVINKPIRVKSIYYADDGEPQDGWPAWCQLHGLGALRCVYIGSAGAVLEGFQLMGGYSPEHGGGAYLAGGSLEQCMITDCRAAIQGGGVNIAGAGTVRNTLIARNRANYGGGVYAYKGGLLEHCTIISNSVSNAGGGINAVTGTSYLTVYNSIMYYNTPHDCNGLVRYVTCCSMTPLPVFAGGGDCFTNAPLLEDVSGGNYRLRGGSPCIDRATNLAWQATDVDGETYPRVIGARADVGAFEHSPLHYLALTASNIWPYLCWSTAATNIEAALGATGSGDTIMAASGTYVLVEHDDPLTIEIPGAVTLCSASGPANTVINGNGQPALYLRPQAALEGFTITNCASGIEAEKEAAVRNCWLLGNHAMFGAGVILDRALAERCIIAGNRATQHGGGVYVGSGSVVRSCLIMRNTAGSNGGGLYTAYGGQIENCTIVSNSAHYGGGMYLYKGGTNLNSIVYYNHATWGVANVVCRGLDIWHAYSTMTPLVSNLFAGPGLQTNEPRFVNITAADFRLQFASPCRDTGTNLTWMSGALDLEGNPRMIGEHVDRGCYEYIPEPAAWSMLALCAMCDMRYAMWRRRKEP